MSRSLPLAVSCATDPSPDDDLPFNQPPDPDEAWTAAPLDVPDLADQISSDPATAAARLAALTPPQRVMQAVAHAAWFDVYDLPVGADEILRAYEQCHAPGDLVK